MVSSNYSANMFALNFTASFKALYSVFALSSPILQQISRGPSLVSQGIFILFTDLSKVSASRTVSYEEEEPLSRLLKIQKEFASASE